MLAARHFALQREWTASHARHSSIRRQNSNTEWLDSQAGVNATVERIKNHDPTLTQIKIIQSSGAAATTNGDHHQHPIPEYDTSNQLQCLGLFRALKHNRTVTSLALIGAGLGHNMDWTSSQALTQAVVAPSCGLERLQITHVSLALLPWLASALDRTQHLQHLHLTFGQSLQQQEQQQRERIQQEQRVNNGVQAATNMAELLTRSKASQLTWMLLTALARNQGLESLHLHEMDLSEYETTTLIQVIQDNTTLKELRLVKCNLTNVQPLCQAIQQSQRFIKVDLSHNDTIAKLEQVAPLLECPQLTELSLSQCGLKNDEGNMFGQALQANTRLQRLSLDMNPLTATCAQNLLEALQFNTTLLRLFLFVTSPPDDTSGDTQQPGDESTCLMTTRQARELRYWANLNEAGRARVQRQPFQTLPPLAASVKHEPPLIFGLLQEAAPLLFGQTPSSTTT